VERARSLQPSIVILTIPTLGSWRSAFLSVLVRNFQYVSQTANFRLHYPDSE
jgi:hypothetical protein